MNDGPSPHRCGTPEAPGACLWFGSPTVDRLSLSADGRGHHRGPLRPTPPPRARPRCPGDDHLAHDPCHFPGGGPRQGPAPHRQAPERMPALPSRWSPPSPPPGVWARCCRRLPFGDGRVPVGAGGRPASSSPPGSSSSTSPSWPRCPLLPSCHSPSQVTPLTHSRPQNIFKAPSVAADCQGN